MQEWEQVFLEIEPKRGIAKWYRYVIYSLSLYIYHDFQDLDGIWIVA